MKNILFLLVLFAGSFYCHAQSDTRQTTSSEKVGTTQTKVKVFPNPATNVVNILGLKNSAKAEILISDMYGNLLLSYHWEIRNNAVNIPISTLEAGIYMVAIHSQEQNVKTKFYKR
ncbi:T9SS type A sorting domain-containing protein [Kriegella aquimaris]|uniref:Por secretion system C-terminal sorting domain-containing protein n=1 Tax=Kriegella aquimaris TaxID=192904 RepID=A0A1G9WRB0_9FLAO|nr:T9SS type A sorting domain-containing protein [Kriegella aquimaris]SDM86666.1 Por secretion system C-terminal sorting domain-containing protein [Kriegella aquimaris]